MCLCMSVCVCVGMCLNVLRYRRKLIQEQLGTVGRLIIMTG